MGKWLDFFRLITRVPRAREIFLRKDYEKIAGLLRWLAHWYRRTFLTSTRIVVVAGSLGKTTARRAVHAALECPERNFSYSNYGAALAWNLLRVRPGDRHAAIEAGIGGPGWMEVYSWFLQPDIVVMTSIKSDHFRSFPTLEHTRNEKVRIVSLLNADKVAFLNGDDPHVRWMATQTKARVVTFGLGEDNDIRALNLNDSPDGLSFDIQLRTRRLRVRTRYVGEHMVYPFLAALAVAEWEGVDLKAAMARIADVHPSDSRMELIRLPGGITVLDDSFKGGLETVHSALDALSQLPASRRIVLFGGVEDPPGKWRDIHRDVGRRLGQVVDLVFYLDSTKNMSSLRAGATEAGMAAHNLHAIGTRVEAAAPILRRELKRGDILLVKGKSTQRLRRTVLALPGKRVDCAVKYCGVKVTSCDVCPLLNAPEDWFRNQFIARYVRP